MQFNGKENVETIKQAVRHLHRGGMSPENIESFILVVAQKVCKPPIEAESLKRYINRVTKSGEKATIMEQVREFIRVTEGKFSVTTVQQWVTSGNKDSNKAILMALSRLCKEDEPLIERIDAGIYRIIDRSFAREDWKDADTTDYEINLPLKLEDYVVIGPGDLIIYNGVTNSGKTTWCFDTIRRNHNGKNVYYFSSEINARALKRRLSKCDTLDIGDWNFVFGSDWTNPVDVVQSGALNIIDYIEPPQGEYYKIPQLLSDIHRKLKDGVAICCLQKNKDKAYGVGGQQVLNKACLSINLDPDYPITKATIVKAKDHRQDGVNPEGYVHKFQILHGVKILPQGSWGPEY